MLLFAVIFAVVVVAVAVAFVVVVVVVVVVEYVLRAARQCTRHLLLLSLGGKEKVQTRSNLYTDT